MTKPASDHKRIDWNGLLGIFVLGSAIGACYGMFFGWRAHGLEGVLTQAVLERAGKSGIGTVLGLFMAIAIARRPDTSALLGATVGLVFPAVYDLPIGAVLASAFLGGTWSGFLSRFELLPGFARQELFQRSSSSEPPGGDLEDSEPDQ
jgi:hypothetical protein